MFSYNIPLNPSFRIDKRIVGKIFKIINNNIDKPQNGILNIVFLDDISIKNLNKMYRNVDSTTDVLSFHYFDDFSFLSKNDIAGEIVMSENKIIFQGKKYRLGSEKEFYKLLIHSILHILGYDHEEGSDYQIMQELEKKVWKKILHKSKMVHII